jgi:hypothetical protein
MAWIVLEALKGATIGCKNFLTPPLQGCLPLNLTQRFGDDARTVDLEGTAIVRRTGHSYFLFRVNLRWISSISAITCSAGIPSSISVYFCKSAAVNSRRSWS